MRETLLMDSDWKFHEGDIADETVHGYMYTYMSTKTERGRGPASIDYDDSDWETVELPHDYVVRNEPTPEGNPVHGSLIRRNAWYRKYFRLEEGDEDRRIRLIFEGICSKSTIWVNGCYQAFHDSAYTEIELDISDIARYGDDINTVTVYVDNSDYEGWWYEGGGIYRHVWLIKTEETAIEHYGIWIHPRQEEERIWKVPIETTIKNDAYREEEVKIVQEIEDGAGNTVLHMEKETAAGKRDTVTVHQEGELSDPALWSPESPNLYRLTTKLYKKDVLQDKEVTVFGFRSICFDPDKGFLLNGIPTKIKGMCLHEDHGGLGVALPDRIKEFRIRRMKEMGCNGYRFSHNPHSRQTLEACDRLGMLVMDENRWFESSQTGLARLENMVKRDRNHPSVIIWSVGNEESLQAGKRGKKIMASMKDRIHKLDRTRPVLMAMHTGLLEEGAADTADMVGMNYNIELHDKVHKRYPDKAIIFSEANNASDEDVLGNKENGIRTWEIVRDHPYICGLFAWTGMDYRGEHDYPGLFAPCGCMDQNGYPRNCFSLYENWWKEKKEKRRGIYWERPEQYGEAKAFCLMLENEDVRAGCRDVAILTLTAVDEQGRWVPDAEKCFRITKCSGGKLLVTGNGDVKDASDRRKPEGRLFHGIAQILIEAEKEHLEIEIASEEGMERLHWEMDCPKGNAICSVSSQQSRYVTKWEMADWVSGRPEHSIEAYQKQSNFHKVEIGHGTQMHDLYKDNGFLVYHSRAGLPVMEKEQKNKELTLQFELLEGKADVMIALLDPQENELCQIQASKEYEEPGELEVFLPSGAEYKYADIWVCLEVFMPFCGITKPVRWQYK